jgi:FkbM family methyltransferase
MLMVSRLQLRDQAMRIPNPVKANAKAFLATAALQPLWRGLHRLSLYGMGFRNGNPKRNGEEFVARSVLAKIDARTVIDVGANRGEFVRMFLEAAPEAAIHCFEPSTRYFAELSTSFSNGQVRLNNLALSDREGEVEFDEPENSGSRYGSIIARRALNPGVTWRKSTVQTTALDLYAARNGLDRIDYLKIDVDGGERAVLSGASTLIQERKIHFIHMEMSENNILTELTLQRLAQLLPEYSIFRMLPRALVPLIDPSHAYHPFDEIFHYSNLLVVRPDQRPAVQRLLGGPTPR